MRGGVATLVVLVSKRVIARPSTNRPGLEGRAPARPAPTERGPPSRGPGEWKIRRYALALVVLFAGLAFSPNLDARPRYRQLLKKHYGERLAKSLNACTTCHLRKEEVADPEVFGKKPPHNPFGVRLKELGKQFKDEGKPWDLIARLRAVADEDADGDGAPNEIEILAGRRPGD